MAPETAGTDRVDAALTHLGRGQAVSEIRSLIPRRGCGCQRAVSGDGRCQLPVTSHRRIPRITPAIRHPDGNRDFGNYSSSRASLAARPCDAGPLPSRSREVSLARRYAAVRSKQVDGRESNPPMSGLAEYGVRLLGSAATFRRGCHRANSSITTESMGLHYAFMLLAVKGLAAVFMPFTHYCAGLTSTRGLARLRAWGRGWICTSNLQLMRLASFSFSTLPNGVSPPCQALSLVASCSGWTRLS